MSHRQQTQQMTDISVSPNHLLPQFNSLPCDLTRMKQKISHAHQKQLRSIQRSSVLTRLKHFIKVSATEHSFTKVSERKTESAFCLSRMEKFTYAPESSSATAGGGGGARAARAASGGNAGAGQGGGFTSRGGDPSSSGRSDLPRRTGAWIAGSNSKSTCMCIQILK